MPLLFNMVGFGGVLFLALGMDSIFLRVASRMWLIVGWLVVIFIYFSVK